LISIRDFPHREVYRFPVQRKTATVSLDHPRSPDGTGPPLATIPSRAAHRHRPSNNFQSIITIIIIVIAAWNPALVCDVAPSGDWFRINQQVPANPDDILPALPF